MKIRDAFNAFLANSEIYKSKNTVHYETAILKDLQAFFNRINIEDLEDIKNDHINQFIQESKATRKNNTINKYLKALRQLTKFNQVNNLDILNLKLLRVQKRHIKVIQENELKQVLRYINSLNDSNNNLVYKVIIFLFLDSGVRREELLNIKISNIDIPNRMIYLEETKTKEDRFVLFTELSERHIKNLIRIVGHQDYLIWNIMRNRRYSVNDMKSLFRRLKVKLGIKDLSPHMFRHTMATLLYENDAELPTIQKLLGHRDLATTQIYVRASLKKVKKDYERAMRYS